MQVSKDLLSMACLSNSEARKTCMELNIKYQKEDGSPILDPTMYRRLVGSLIYLTMTQPNIAYVRQGVGKFFIHQGLF